MDSSSSYKSEATGMTYWEYQDGRHGCCHSQTDMTLFILILNLFLTLKLTLKTDSNP